MRNLKRALSLALASVMLLGMMVVGSGAASYADVADTDNVEAIEVLKAAKIMIGDTNGNFNPDKAVTRNEAAVMMSNMLGLDAEDYAGTAPFTDVPAWAEAYVSACYANGIVSGTSATTYTGDATVTAAELGLMAQKALGYFKHASDFGDDWKLAAVKNASDIDLYDGINAGADTAMTRNDAAQLLLNALESKVVYDSVSGSTTNITGSDLSVSITPIVKYLDKVDSKGYDYNKYDSKDSASDLYLIEKLYGEDFTKVTDTDKYGRPGYAWENKKNDTIVFVADEALATYAGADFDKDTLKDDFEDWKSVAEIVYNGGDAGLDLTDLYEKNGYTIEVYGDEDAEKIETIVVIEAYAAEITAVNTDDDEEVAEVELTVYEATGEKTITIDVEDDEDAYALVAGYEEDDVLMVILAPGWDGELDIDKALKDVDDVEVIEGTATSISVDSWYNGWVKIDGVKYEFANEYSQNSDLKAKADGAFYLYNGYVVHFDGEVGKADDEYVYVVRSTKSTDKWGVESFVSEVVYADGTSETIDVKEAYAAGVYTYEYDKDEKHNVLTPADTTGVTASIETGKTYIDGTNTANSNTTYVVVSLTSAGAFDEAKTYTGYKNVADLANGTIYSVADEGKAAKLVYVIGATATISNDNLIYVAGSSIEKVEDAGLGTIYTYNAIIDGEIVQISAKSAEYNGLYNAVVIDSDGVYTKMTAEGVEYELVEGEFKKASDEVVTIGGKAMAYTDDVAVYVIGTDGAISKGSITRNYSNGTDYNINVMYTANKDGQVDSIYILKVAPEL